MRDNKKEYTFKQDPKNVVKNKNTKLIKKPAKPDKSKAK
jgi:hypothetical protein